MQSLAVVLAWSVTTLLAGAGLIGAVGYSNAESYSYFRIRDLVAQSVVKASDGSLRLEPTGGLREEMERIPTLRFAAFKLLSQEALPGSSRELSEALRSVKSVEINGMDFFLNSAAGSRTMGSVWRWNTEFGPLFIAANGYVFTWTDPFYAFRNELVSQSLYLFLIALVSAIVAWIAVWRGLAPMRQAVETIERVDMDSLNQSISTEGMPREVRPFVDAVNSALERLDAGVARMRRYTANAAHELRTPVAILRARLENPEEQDFKTKLKWDARRIQGIVEQLLISARLNERQAPLDQEVDLATSVRRIVADYSPLIFKAGRRIAFETEDPHVTVLGNLQAIECVVANLIDNAVRAEPKGGTVFVRVKIGGIVEVIDHGAGIAESEREMIFEPFWRKSETTPGTGLGLAIVKEIVERHGGAIRVEGGSKGGTVFKAAFRKTEMP
ncbi:sensor histidine kinase [Methylocystis heyeri]|uniref:histidine kinase n=1 Tax=Methylocystis heyeri TaxID=391905 RepID=A0A6B8KEL5_9HYPH|nr:HAMP domain-containing sensor histidine kinase [Methylocystis heyeri]QGM45455.1 HAMP domain-containing protein [Methylocystis heyeri]